MASPLFTLTPAIKGIAANAIDTLINQLGKPCRLVYPPVMVACPQGCQVVVGAKQMTDIWRTGGSVKPGNLSTCSVCGGTGQMAQSQSETITLLCNFDVKPWKTISIPDNVDFRSPGGLCITKGFLTDMPKVKRCIEAVLATNVEPYVRYTYRLHGEPMDTSNIVQGRYFSAIWLRAGA